MNIPWDLVISTVLELVGKCLESQEESAVRVRLAAPGPLDWLRLRAGLWRRGLRRAELDAAMEAARKQVATPTGESDWIAELLDQAKVGR